MNRSLASLLVLVFTFSCVTVQQIDLDGNAVSSTDAVAKKQFVSALSSNNGTIDLDWKTDDKKIAVSSTNDLLTVGLADVKRTNFYHDLEGLDFRGGLAVRIEARVVDGDDVKLRLQVTDVDGLQTNGKIIDNTVAKTDDFRPYFFRMKGAFIQTFPELANVNGADIRRIAFIVSPTGKAVTGRIEIKSIKVISDKEVYKTKKLASEGSQGGVVYNSDTKFKSTDWTTESGYELSQVGEDLVVTCTGVGPRYESFSTSIPVTSVTKMKVVMKYTGNVQPFVRFDIEDVNGFVSNRKPAMVRLMSDEYKEYTFDYSDRLRQAYPKQVDVDGTRIVKITGFVDPAYLPFTGTVYIKSIGLY
jgi:hypothetical protein